MEEIWRDVPGYEGLYQVSSEGRLMNSKNGRMLDGSKRKSYHSGKAKDVRRMASLTTAKYCSTREYIYRLVAKAFPEICGEWFEGCEIDHIDGNPMNDAAENLRVVDHKTNMNNPVSIKRFDKNYVGWERRPVLQYDKNGNFIREWESINDCKKAGFNNVWHCIHGLLKTNKGYIWKYKE